MPMLVSIILLLLFLIFNLFVLLLLTHQEIKAEALQAEMLKKAEDFHTLCDHYDAECDKLNQTHHTRSF